MATTSPLDGKPMMHFDTNDGLLSNIFMPNAALKASDGRIYLGTVNGFNTFYPYQIKTNSRIPKVMITSVRVMNEKRNVADRIELSYHDKMISISFAALSYCMPQKNLYSYILKGFDRQWVMTGNNSTATYTNLAPGTYKFMVRGSNNDGVWSNEEAVLEIVVNPPFYWSMTAKVLYLIIIVLIIIYAYRYTITRERKKHERQMAKLNEEKQIEVRNTKIQFFTTIAHEIRTPLSLIIGPLEKLVKTTAQLSDSERKNLRIIDRNAHRLLDLVNQLLDFSKVENRSMVVRFKVQNICNMLQAVTERFEPTFAQNGINFKIEMPDSHFTAVIDNEAITKVVSNLLTNARKYTNDFVRLSCHVMPDDNSFAIEVEDNGVGIDPNDHERIFNAFYQSADNKPGTGIGLSIVKNIVDQHHGKVSVKSEPGHGAIFTVVLPVRQDVGAESELTTDKVEESNNNMTILSSAESQLVVPVDDSAVLIVDDNNDMLEYLEACCLNIMHSRRLLREKYSTTPSEPITEIASTSVDKDFLERMQRIIEENFANPDLNVNFLADKLCISRSRLFAKIKTLADVSPNEMIQIVRLKKAAQMLSEGNMKVSEVCYTVGFSNPSYFSKCFYKQFGVSPSEIRK